MSRFIQVIGFNDNVQCSVNVDEIAYIRWSTPTVIVFAGRDLSLRVVEDADQISQEIEALEGDA